METSDEGKPLTMGSIDDPCVSAAEVGETQILLSDGTYYGFGIGRPTPTAEEIQKELAEAKKPALSEERIAEIRENGLIK
jgi:hypothetical protein